ncbi:hypothetical protein MM440_11455 [Arsenicicoccus piscis]|uniref:hypothetical protein n=1 Tax=Arsenicicoccus piscis TaxID=673954 RepID=UPI001F4C76C8|nr:hypothetical protein [Arsenicicoccus piscis]MCH8628369.1 hypothetical protein [Arsenicicoccus piscis]
MGEQGEGEVGGDLGDGALVAELAEPAGEAVDPVAGGSHRDTVTSHREGPGAFGVEPGGHAPGGHAGLVVACDVGVVGEQPGQALVEPVTEHRPRR